MPTTPPAAIEPSADTEPSAATEPPADISAPEAATDCAEMPLTEHLAELRRRILLVLFLFTVIFCCCYYFSAVWLKLLTAPLRSFNPALRLAVLSLTESFFAQIKLAAAISAYLSLPIVFWQIWRFIAPGLHFHERLWGGRLVIPLLLLFYSGTIFGYLFVLPAAITFFLCMLGNDFQVVFSLAEYLDFSLLLVTIPGLIFELPLLIIFLDFTGLVQVENLRQRRREAIVAAFILGAVFSPPDPFSQILLAVPLYLLLEVGIFGSMLFRQMRDFSDK